MYKKYSFILTLIISLLLSAGCGSLSSQSPPAENAGLSEENVVFVRVHLDSDEDVANDADSRYIGREAAQQAALEHAGFDADSVLISHIHLEHDDGRWQYDVEFYKDNIEYDYDIDAITGAVLSCHQEAWQHSGHYDSAYSANLITEDTAKQLALDYAGVTEAETQNLKVELDYDDGYAEYEVEWQVGRTEYACDVDACTGEILSFEKELD